MGFLKHVIVVVAFILFGVSLNSHAQQSTTKYGVEYIDAMTPTFFEGSVKKLPAIVPWKPGDPIKEIPKR